MAPATEPARRVRLTARVLLFDTMDRILLMKGRFQADPMAAAEWFTIGGGVEPGESVEAAAAREIREESGIAEFVLGPTVWRRDVHYPDPQGRPVLFREHYLLARCECAEPVRDGWSDLERALMDDIRWWSLADLTRTDEPVHPSGLAVRLRLLLAGSYPATPEWWG